MSDVTAPTPIAHVHTLIVWTVLAASMLILTALAAPSWAIIGLCFLAWSGGIVTTLAWQTVSRRVKFNRRR